MEELLPSLTAKLITKTLSYLYTKKVKNHSTATTIGNSLIEAYAYKATLYHEKIMIN